MLDQTSGEHLLTSKLLLATTAADVSQPLPLGDDNQVLLQAWIESSSTSLASTPVQVQLQTSSDLDNWTDRSGFVVTLSQAPAQGTYGTYGGSDLLQAPYIRLRFEGGGDDVLLGASVRLYRA
ncbi:MAG: hypothetical protein R3F43_19715 [bacterium]